MIENQSATASDFNYSRSGNGAKSEADRRRLATRRPNKELSLKVARGTRPRGKESWRGSVLRSGGHGARVCTYILYDSRTIGTLGPRNARWYSLCVDHIPLPCLETLLFHRLFHLTHTYVPRGPVRSFTFVLESRQHRLSPLLAPCQPPTSPLRSIVLFLRPISLFSAPPTKLRINSLGRFGTLANFPIHPRGSFVEIFTGPGNVARFYPFPRRPESWKNYLQPVSTLRRDSIVYSGYFSHVTR